MKLPALIHAAGGGATFAGIVGMFTHQGNTIPLLLIGCALHLHAIVLMLITIEIRMK